ncbi:heavy metal translocating P-type ATPase [Parvibium lacunae]|uniref:Heavy metal translocating P-type ATPase n=1 Tax=Parvibium lacunae TaxID=1888893 RepID=A0A368L826_9BURK|nr:heavy metal translocating P-type ATPase [Parvibium lacunae]RCS59661.1 heavy metal translocating P-type ATPase [Parvibium lacunae]
MFLEKLITSGVPLVNDPAHAQTSMTSKAGYLGYCFHCGQEVLDTPVFYLDETAQAIAEKLMPPSQNGAPPSPPILCCAGCQAAANTILRSGLGDYYRQRHALGLSSELTPLPGLVAEAQNLWFPALPEAVSTAMDDTWSLYDSPATQAHFATPYALAGTNKMALEAYFVITGLRCGACLWLIEQQLLLIPGVLRAEVNYSNERLHLIWEPDACRLSPILSTLDRLGYQARPFDPLIRAAQAKADSRKRLKRLFVAAMGMMQVMMYAYPAYIADTTTLDQSANWLMQWASLILTLPVVAYSAAPFFTQAWRDFKHRQLSMDVPVAIGIAAAFFGSCFKLWQDQGAGEVYFDAVTMFVFFLLLARHIESQMRQQAAAELDKLQTVLPSSCLRWQADAVTQPGLQQGQWQSVSTSALNVGDRILIKAGDTIPADGHLLTGPSSFNLAVLTGESLPIDKQIGDAVVAGSVNITQTVEVVISAVPQRSMLAQLAAAAERAALNKPMLALFSERIARYFTVSLLLFALLCGSVWWWFEGADQAITIAIMVLVVSCPCALSLAVPTVQACALSQLMRHGVLVIRPQALQKLAQINTLVVDKTGTLTTGHLSINQIQAANGYSTEAVLQIACALEQHSLHPIAQAFHRHTVITTTTSAASQVKQLSITGSRGQHDTGLEGIYEGRVYRLGVANFSLPHQDQSDLTAYSSLLWNVKASDAPPEESTSLNLILSRQTETSWEPVAHFILTDQPRSEALDFVEYLHDRNLNVALLSGDRTAAVRDLANKTGIERWIANCSPETKRHWVSQHQQQGQIVAMLGDGLNDAPVLAQADVSIAMANGAALAQLNADIVCQFPGLSPVREVLRVARQAHAVMRQNLYWALLYNGIAIPAAACGWLSAWQASLGMALSSLFVVLNARRVTKLPSH